MLHTSTLSDPPYYYTPVPHPSTTAERQNAPPLERRASLTTHRRARGAARDSFVASLRMRAQTPPGRDTPPPMSRGCENAPWACFTAPATLSSSDARGGSCAEAGRAEGTLYTPSHFSIYDGTRGHLLQRKYAIRTHTYTRNARPTVPPRAGPSYGLASSTCAHLTAVVRYRGADERAACMWSGSGDMSGCN